MPEPETRQLRQPRFTTLDLYRLIDAYIQAGEETVGRPLRLTADTLRRVKRRIERGLLGPWSAEQLLSGIAREYANLASGLLSALPATIEGITRRLGNPSPAILSEYRIPIHGSEPEDVGTMIELGADGDVPFVLPARIVDASQGWAVWFVDSSKVVELLQNGVNDGHAILADFEPLNCGHGRSAVMLIGADFRVGDLGPYREVALAVSLTPREEAAKPGLFFARMAVSAQFPIGPARQVWGFHLDHCPDLHVDYDADYAQFKSGPGADGEFCLTVPRFGTGRSFEIPIVIYSARQQDPLRPNVHPVRSIMDRSGIQEGVQIGGSVGVRLGRKAADDGRDGRCLCSDSKAPCLCDALRHLEIDKRLPAANGWTERMTGNVGAPGSLRIQPFGNH